MASSNAEAAAVAKAPRRRRGRDRVAALLEAAAAVFARAGYEAATMTEIAALAGASIGSLYQFFPTKPLLAEALFQRDMAALAEALQRAGEEARAGAWPLDRLADHLFVTLLGFVERHPALPIVADRREGGAFRPGMREQLAAIIGAAAPGMAPPRVWLAAGLVLLVMKGAVAVRVNEDPDGAGLVEAARAMLRGHFTA